MKANAKLFIILATGIFLISCKGPSSGKMTKADNDSLWAREGRHLKRAIEGSPETKITVITDAARVEKMKAAILSKIAAENKKYNAERQPTLAERYKAGDRSTLPEIIRVLKGSNQPLKREILNDLQKRYDDPVNYAIRDNELIQLILAKINDPEDEEGAVQLAGYNKLPGAMKMFEARLLSTQTTQTDRLFYWISQEGKSLSSLQYVIGLLKKNNMEEKDLASVYGSIEYFAKHGNEEIKKTVVDFCLFVYDNHLLAQKYYDELADYGYSSGNPVEPVLSCLFNFGDRKVIPIAQKFLKLGLRDDHALAALARLDPANYQATIMEYLKNQKKFYDALQAATILYKHTKNEQIPTAVLIQYEKIVPYDSAKIETIISTLVDMQDTAAIADCDKILTNKKIASDIKYHFGLRKIQLEDVATDLYKFGLVDVPVSQAMIDKVKKDGDAEFPGFDTYGFLYELGICVYYDAETDLVPVTYDSLINNYTKACKGKLQGLQVWMDAAGSPQNGFNYTLTVYFNNRIYIAQPEENDDWYDVHLVNALMNRILGDAGIKERFYPLINANDQWIKCIFGEEEKVKHFAEKYKLD